MPGILPMKVIKIGSTAQSRIAQACDRCRSKKIRCDGVTPCCSQCASVGFECKTSDKLSRRAFPRGYTESLEERVRALEAEVKDLKNLLDEKDEKMDILSRINSHSPVQRKLSLSMSPLTYVEPKPMVGEQQAKEVTFRVQQSPFLIDDANVDSYFMGASSGRSFVDAFKRKVQESGKSCSGFDTEAFFAANRRSFSSLEEPLDTLVTSKAPPRLVSDQMINIFFQEWAPLFPVLHRPSFLRLYADYVADPEGMTDQQGVAQLNLVFGIAALSAEWNKQDAASFESQWQTAIDSISTENTMATLQCLVLAQIYCITKCDYTKLLHYKGMAVSLSHRLGLHQNQKCFALGALTSETRKKVFWTLYTLDCFSAALLGLPKLLKEEDIQTEYPSDVDDENVNERGFQPTLPGEFTRLSSALALFRATRIMSKVLDENYPSALSHEISLQNMGVLNDELDVWLNNLAPHLRLQFVQDKPSTNIISSRAPLLSLAYHYIRSLIHRPAVASSLGPKASQSIVALADSSKHIVQIIQLLEERRMSFSFCLNKNELLFLAGFGLLYQGLDLDQHGKLIRDSQRLVCSSIEILERNKAPGAAEFKKMACSMIAIDRFSKAPSPPEATSTPRRKSDGTTTAPLPTPKSTRKQLQAIASRFSFGVNRSSKHEDAPARRATVPTDPHHNNGMPHPRNNSQLSISSARTEPIPYLNPTKPSRLLAPINPPNLDYLQFNTDPLTYEATKAPKPTTTATMPSDWDRLFSSLNPPNSSSPYSPNTFLSSPTLLNSYLEDSPSFSTTDWSMMPQLEHMPTAPAGQSVPSLSEESLTSGEEFGGGSVGGDYMGIMMPNDNEFGELGLECTFGL